MNVSVPNEIQLPFVYDELKWVSHQGLVIDYLSQKLMLPLNLSKVYN